MRADPLHATGRASATGGRSPTTASCGAGRWTSSRTSGRHVGVLRRARLAPLRAACSPRSEMPGAAGSRARSSTTPRTCCRADAADAHGEVAVLHASELRELREITWGELTRAWRAVGRRAARPGRAARRPRRRLHAEHPRDARRAARGGQHRGDLVQRRARVRRPQRDRPLRPDRAQVLLAVDGYRHGGKDFDRTRDGRQPASRSCPTVEHAVLLAYLDARRLAAGGCAARSPGSSCSSAARAPSCSSSRCPSSTRCGCSTPRARPACPRRSCRATAASCSSSSRRAACTWTCDRGDRMFWFTTTGWMMWNFLVGCLHTDAAIVLYDGSPAHPDLGVLWDLAERARDHAAWASARACSRAARRRAWSPPRAAISSTLRAIGSTGSPLAPESFRWVYEHVRRRHLAVLHQRRHGRVHRLRRRLPAAARLRGRAAVPRARLRVRPGTSRATA